jgi:hypothetical protein
VVVERLLDLPDYARASALSADVPNEPPDLDANDLSTVHPLADVG